jgi:hypothetical protein
MINRVRQISAAVGAAGIVTLGAGLFGIFAGPIGAQQPATTPPAAATQTSAPAAARTMLSLTEIEKIVNAQGIRVSELEVKDNVVEVEGRDKTDREVELLVDRRSGEILTRKVED